MFFKGKKPVEIKGLPEQPQESAAPEEVTPIPEEQPQEDAPAMTEAYAFYKPDPYPKELVSVLKSMLQRLFPDTKRAYLLEAQKSDQKGYLLIVDIDSKFLKIINIYLDGETKRVRGNTPIECILYSKSGSLTEGIDPFYAKENLQSKSNNLASKEFSGEVVFAKMPEFELWSGDKERARDKSDARVKPTSKKELFGILNEYGTNKSGEISTVAMAAIREYEFYIPYTLGEDLASDEVDITLPIDENLRFKKLLSPEDGIWAVPLFTEMEDALSFAQRDNCKIVLAKYKDFASSSAAELTGFDGVLINPDGEELFLPASHPLLKEE